VHVLAGDGTDFGQVVITCPFCRRSLPLDEQTVAKQFTDSVLDHPRLTPAFNSSPSSPWPLPLQVSLRHSRDALGRAGRTPISSVMTRDVISVRHDLSVEKLTSLFLEQGLHGVPVLDDEEELVGFISMTDLLRSRYESADAEESFPLRVPTREGGAYELGEGFHAAELARSTVGELMTPITISLEESAPITLAAAVMACEGVHRIPVVSAAGKLVGVLSTLDVMRWLAEEDGYPVAKAIASPAATNQRPSSRGEPWTRPALQHS
jgi:CBS domain-containing protein